MRLRRGRCATESDEEEEILAEATEDEPTDEFDDLDEVA